MNTLIMIGILILIGILIGLALLLYCCVQVASDADRKIEQMWEERENN